jgi:hypothetical protein
MATLQNPMLQEARTYVRNYLATGNISTQAPEGEPKKLKTVDEFANAYNTMFDQVVASHGGTGSVSDRRAHIHTGTGGVLIALMEQTESPLKEELMKTVNNNGSSMGYIVINGQNANIAKSPCTTHDVADFANHRGLWAGQQPG